MAEIRLPLRIKRWQAVVILGFMVVPAVFVVVRRLGLMSIPLLPITFVPVAYTEEEGILIVQPPPSSSRYGAHNFRRLNHVITEYDDDVAARLATLVERRSSAADPDLIHLIVDMLDPPSTHMVKMSRQLLSTPQSRETDKILKQKVSKFICVFKGQPATAPSALKICTIFLLQASRCMHHFCKKTIAFGEFPVQFLN